MVLTLGSVVMIAPFVFNLSKSLQTAPQTFAFPVRVWIPDPFTWFNYVEAYEKIGTRAFVNSALLTVVVVGGQTILGMMAGFAFSTLRFPLRDSLLLLIIGGLMVPFHVIMIRCSPSSSRSAGSTPTGASSSRSWPTPTCRCHVPAVLPDCPREIYEAGILDGAGPIRVFRSLYAPLAGPTVAAFVIVSFLAAWNLYAWPFLAVADPDLRVVTLQPGHRGRHLQLQLQPAAARDTVGHVAAVDDPGDGGLHVHAAPLRGEHGPLRADRMSREGLLTESSAADLASDEARQRLVRDGYLFLRSFLPPANLTAVESAILEAVAATAGWIAEGTDPSEWRAGPSVASESYDDPDFLAMYRRVQSLHELAHHPLVISAVQALLEDEVFVHSNHVARVVGPSARVEPTRIHQDWRPVQARPTPSPCGYRWPISPPLGGLRILEGSQTGGVVPFDPERASIRIDNDDPRWRTASYRRGDALIFHSLTVHAGGPTPPTGSEGRASSATSG